jgi:predicted nuclease of restriction endonuclease-like RecB superfamily
MHGHKAPYNGKRVKYKGYTMRSLWEVTYAKYLDKNKIKWVYETVTFDLGESTYTPDFYLPKTDMFVEIKGFWRPEAKEKFKLFKKLYPYIKIKVIEDIKSLGD